jgi:hypothetical protein
VQGSSGSGLSQPDGNRFLPGLFQLEVGDSVGWSALGPDSPGAGFALAALGGHPHVELDVVKAAATARGLGDGFVTDSVADADDHGGSNQTMCLQMIIARIPPDAKPALGTRVCLTNGQGVDLASAHVAHLALQVVGKTHFLHQLQLGFQKVHVFLGVVQDLQQQIT